MYQNFQSTPQFQGYGFANPKPQVMKMTNPAMTNPDERKLLTNNNKFSFKIEPVEMAAAFCTHKDPNTGEFLTVPDNDGTGNVTCSLCHTKLNPDIINDEEAERITNEFVNLVEVTKMLGIDISEDVIRQLCKIIPVVKRWPQYFKISANSFNKYTSQYNHTYIPQSGGINYAGLYNAMRGGAGAYPMYNNPYAYSNPSMMQTPFMNQQMMTMPGGYGLYAEQAPAYQQPMQPAQNMAPINSPIMPQPVAAQQPAQAPAQPTATAPTATIEQQVQL